MKTLKYQLLAASMFACTAAFAQTAPAGPDPKAFKLTPTATAGTAAQDRSAYKTGTTNDALVQQSINNQYANVDQIAGPVSGNTADVYQLGGDHNNATIAQDARTAGFAGRNEARIDQFGYYNTSDQKQTGGGNHAYSVQASSTTYSSASQTQTGQGNDAYIRQTNGKNNYASQSQGVEGENNAQIFQEGTNGSTAIQTQMGGRENEASTTQNGAASYSQINQNGSQNQAIVTQR
ncbi:MAG: hypothetical protein ACRYF0_14660 [Janthinobacterium lividum]